MESKELVNCPVCNSKKTTKIIDLDCGNFDNSTLYQSVKIHECEKCGHVFNSLSSKEFMGLIRYYNEEYAPANLGSNDKIGDRPGSNNQFTFERYGHIFGLIESHLNTNSIVLDVGCAMGGFLDYLQTKGIKNLNGIDPTQRYIDYAKRKKNYTIKRGSAEAIPFESESFDVLVLDQVLEHVADPLKVFSEAKRVLKNGGIFCLGVPDASRYDEIYFFDFYWFILREHIQHFDIEHLKLLAQQEGFELVNFTQNTIPMMSEKMMLPNLNACFRLTKKTTEMNITPNCFNLKKGIGKYVNNNWKKVSKKKNIINKLLLSGKPIYVWGIGREFLFLYESLGLKICNIIGLIDLNEYKQTNCTVSKMKIHDKSILCDATTESILLITAIAHVDAIKKTLEELGYRGQLLEL